MEAKNNAKNNTKEEPIKALKRLLLSPINDELLQECLHDLENATESADIANVVIKMIERNAVNPELAKKKKFFMLLLAFAPKYEGGATEGNLRAAIKAARDRYEMESKKEKIQQDFEVNLRYCVVLTKAEIEELSKITGRTYYPMIFMDSHFDGTEPKTRYQITGTAEEIAIFIDVAKDLCGKDRVKDIELTCDRLQFAKDGLNAEQAVDLLEELYEL